MIQEQAGDLWDCSARGEWIAITTNGITKTNGQAVMGAGLAKQAATRYPDLPSWLGQRLMRFGNRPHCFRSIRLITFPTKGNWQQPSSLQLITDSLHAIRTILDHEHIARLYCPRPGCGRGQLEWPLVKETIAPLIDDRFIFLTPPAPTRPRH